jgi:hypothetical protein
VLAALRGDPGRATALTAKVRQADKPHTMAWDRLKALHAAGLADLLQHQPQQAAGSLSAVWKHAVREGVEDPRVFPVAADLVEALAEAGRLDAAGEVIGRLGGLAAAQRHPWGLATVTRSAAVVKLADGYDEAAAAQLAQAATAYQALGSVSTPPGRCCSWAGPSAGSRSGPQPGTHLRRPGPRSRRAGARAGPRRRPRSWTGSAGAGRRPRAA